jgi:hypothetical protein
MTRKFLAVAAMLAVSTSAAFAQSGTVNAYNSADEAKAEAAVKAAGFTSTTLASSQAGNFYIKAMKGTDTYYVTVTADGHVYASLPLHPGA